MCTRPGCPPQRGLSLIELVVAIVVITVGLLGLLGVYRVALVDSFDPLFTKQTLSLAEALMDEVLRAPHTACDKDDPLYDAVFRDPNDPAFPANPTQCSTGGNATIPLGSEVVNGVADTCPFDNVDDYNGYAVIGNDVRTTCLGAVVPTGYTLSVAVTRATLGNAAFGLIDGTAAGTATDGEALRIAVTATGPKTMIVLAGFRARFAPRALP